MEHRLAAIWQRAFGLNSISTTDNFFDLGGHSLLMLRVHAAISQDLERPIPITALFQYPTIATLAAHLDPGPAPVSSPHVQVSASPPNSIQSRANAARAAAQRAAASRR
jgi:acyl carrier protein